MARKAVKTQRHPEMVNVPVSRRQLSYQIVGPGDFESAVIL